MDRIPFGQKPRPLFGWGLGRIPPHPGRRDAWGSKARFDRAAHHDPAYLHAPGWRNAHAEHVAAEKRRAWYRERGA